MAYQNSDNRYYNKLININQKSFLPIFTDSKFIVSQNYNNGSWVIYSDKNNFANTYSSISIVNGEELIIQGTYGNKNATSIKNYIHDIYLGGEHIAGGFGVASAQLRDNLTYIGNSYNSIFSYHVNSRTKFSLSDVDNNQLNNNSELFSIQSSSLYLSSNNTAFSVGLVHDVTNNSYTLKFDGPNLYQYGFYWDMESSTPRTDGLKEVEEIFPEVSHEYDILWDDFDIHNTLTNERPIVCNCIIHYGAHETDSRAVNIAGPLRRTLQGLSSSPYTFRYYYSIDNLYTFLTKGDLFNNNFGKFVSIFTENENETAFAYGVKKNNIIKFSTLNNIEVILNLSECYFEIALDKYLLKHEALYRNTPLNINVFFIPEDKREELIGVLSKEVEHPIIFIYQYNISNSTTKYELLEKNVNDYQNKNDNDINELMNIIYNLKNRVEELENKLSN